MNVIPAPLSMKLQEGEFLLGQSFLLQCEGEGSEGVGAYLANEAENRFGIQLSSDKASPTVYLQLQDHVDLLEQIPNRAEGYVLTISQTDVSITAETRTGLFYGVQTFFQMFPSTMKQHPGDVSIACVQIVDAPRFQWRGALLDVGRHFFEVSFIKRFLDHLAFYKLNRFHWHLTEDQGWRIEIKSYPKLTDVGSWRTSEEDDQRYGGFYTQDEIAEIVMYAKERCIEVMPEIEMPGHCAASLAAYPDLSCKEDVLETPSKWGVYEEVYCAGKDKVLEFLKRVLDEVTELFPFEYVHIGGDEAPKDRWKECKKCQERIRNNALQGEDELQTWFISEIADYLQSKKRKIIGWDEILEGGVPRNATVMSWRGIVGGFIAAKLGYDVIMSPTSHCYLDYKQSDSPDEPGAYYATLTLERVYAFEPIPDARLLVRSDSPGSSGVLPSPSSQMEISEISEVTADTGGMELDESQGKGESEMGIQNGHETDFEYLRPEHKLAEDIQNGRIPPGLTESEQRHVLGGQANVWTEYIEDKETCEYMVLPRICAFSEAVWSPKEGKDLADFYRRLEEHVKLFDALGFSYRPLAK